MHPIRSLAEMAAKELCHQLPERQLFTDRGEVAARLCSRQAQAQPPRAEAVAQGPVTAAGRGGRVVCRFRPQMLPGLAAVAVAVHSRLTEAMALVASSTYDSQRVWY